MKIFGILILLSSLFVQELFAQKPVLIEGKVINNDYEEIMLIGAAAGEVVATSGINKQGTFRFAVNIDSANYYKLSFDEKNYILMIIQPGENIKVKADIKNLYEPVIEGSPETTRLFQALNKIRFYDLKIDSITRQIAGEKQSYVRQAIKQDYGSLANIVLLDNLAVDDDYDIYKEVEAALVKKYPKNLFVEDLKNQMEIAGFLRPGAYPPELNLPDSTGKYIELTSLKGKIVLLDFWASWCVPCKENNVVNRGLYRKYKNKGFEIYAVSLDKDKDTWINSIKNEQLEWIHVSDLKYWASPVINDYRLVGIPYNVLLDKEGKVLGKALSPGKLENMLEEIFGD
ncbi:MAG: AhpC/TSA family protein [Bacteroidia bacterium]|nr:AhpC/TSA family protein [Bacteroidia bacterium]